MEPVRPEFVPDPTLSREEMETLQHEIGAVATFADAVPFDPRQCCRSNREVTRDDADPLGGDGSEDADDAPVVAGIDQAFLDDRAISVVVATRGGEVVERVHAVTDLSIPYVPGLLAFREGESIVAAFRELSVTADLALFDGSGRIHFREAGLATHLGVTFDLPSVGVAKSLLCGRPRESLEDRKLSVGDRVAIEADGDVTAGTGTVIGYAVQTRQYDSGNRWINPLYVSPGHRVGPETAADLAEQCCAGYKLPEPIRLADAHADEVKGSL